MFNHTIQSPYDTASWLSRMTLSWIIPIVRGTPTDVDESKLSALPASIDIEAAYKSLRR